MNNTCSVLFSDSRSFILVLHTSPFTFSLPTFLLLILKGMSGEKYQNFPTINSSLLIHMNPQANWPMLSFNPTRMHGLVRTCVHPFTSANGVHTHAPLCDTRSTHTASIQIEPEQVKLNRTPLQKQRQKSLGAVHSLQLHQQRAFQHYCRHLSFWTSAEEDKVEKLTHSYR